MTFDDAFRVLISPTHEGRGVSLDPKDPGNWTGGRVGVGALKGSAWGLSAAAYPLLDMGRVTMQEAHDIYRRDYWNKVGCDVIPGEMAFQLFDAAVNHGTRRAARWIQTVVGARPDGVIGRVTRGLMAKMDARVMALKFLALRADFYTTCPSWPTDGRGWIHRLADNMRRCAQEE